MDNQIPQELIYARNRYLYRTARLQKVRNIGAFYGWLVHLPAMVLLLANIYPATGWSFLKGLVQLSLLKDLASWPSFYSKNIWIFLLCSIVSATVLPAIVGNIVATSAKKSKEDSAAIMSMTEAEAIELVKKFATPTDFTGIDALSIILEPIAGFLLGCVVGDFLTGLFLWLVTAIFSFFFVAFCSGIISDRTEAEMKGVRKEFDELAEQQKQLEKQLQEKKAAKEAEEAAEKAARAAIAAEKEFLALDDPGDQKALVEKLADAGSPSACNYLGKILFLDYQNNLYTQREKDALSAKIKSYLAVGEQGGIAEAEFLHLTMRTLTESHTLEEWNAFLSQARKLKESASTEETWSAETDDLIKAIIKIIDRTEAKKTTPVSSIPTGFYSSSYSGSSYKPLTNADHDDLDAIEAALGSGFGSDL